MAALNPVDNSTADHPTMLSPASEHDIDSEESCDMDLERQTAYISAQPRSQTPMGPDHELPSDEADEILKAASAPVGHAAKRPRSLGYPCVTDDHGEGVDLTAYFSQFELSNCDIIAICRTFANHLALLERVKTKKPRPSVYFN